MNNFSGDFKTTCKKYMAFVKEKLQIMKELYATSPLKEEVLVIKAGFRGEPEEKSTLAESGNAFIKGTEVRLEIMDKIVNDLSVSPEELRTLADREGFRKTARTLTDTIRPWSKQAADAGHQLGATNDPDHLMASKPNVIVQSVDWIASCLAEEPCYKNL